MTESAASLRGPERSLLIPGFSGNRTIAALFVRGELPDDVTRLGGRRYAREKRYPRAIERRSTPASVSFASGSAIFFLNIISTAVSSFGMPMLAAASRVPIR
jgi:hypothetical protein